MLWPVPSSRDRDVPAASGSFWEDRGDRRHCGVDIYAPARAGVLAVEDCVVVEVGVFTSPGMVHYWNPTFYLLARAKDGRAYNYAELERICAAPGDYLEAGAVLGHVGSVLNLPAVAESSPEYVRRLKGAGVESMLHLELYRREEDFLRWDGDYLGGNWFGGSFPRGLMDPTGLWDCPEASRP